MIAHESCLFSQTFLHSFACPIFNGIQTAGKCCLRCCLYFLHITAHPFLLYHFKSKSSFRNSYWVLLHVKRYIYRPNWTLWNWINSWAIALDGVKRVCINFTVYQVPLLPWFCWKELFEAHFIGGMDLVVCHTVSTTSRHCPLPL